MYVCMYVCMYVQVLDNTAMVVLEEMSQTSPGSAGMYVGRYVCMHVCM